MRAAGRAVGVLAVVALVAAACADAVPTETTTTTIPPIAIATTTQPSSTTSVAPTTIESTPLPEGGEIVIGLEVPPTTLNPFAPGGDFRSTAIIGQLHLAGVYDIDGETRTFIPELVTSLPTPGNGGVTSNEDGSVTVRYEIVEEAVWSDGEPISGADFQFTLDTILALPETAGGIEQGGYHLIMSSVAGPKTFEFTMSRPSPSYQRLFEYVLPKHVVEGTDILSDWDAANWPAAGPFVLDAYAPGEGARLVRNDAYWKTDADSGDRLPHLGAVTVRFVPDPQQLVGGIINGELDIVSPPAFAGLVDTFSSVGNISVHDVPGPFWEHIGFQYGPSNRNAESLNAVLAFREAIAFGTDRVDLAAVAGWGAPLATMRSTAASPQQGGWEKYRYDPVLARERLAVACNEAGRNCDAEPPRVVYTTTSSSDARSALAERLVPMLSEIGVDVELELEDSELFFGDTLNVGTWDLGEWAWVHDLGMAGELTMLEIFDPDSTPAEGNNFYRWGTSDAVHAESGAFDDLRGMLAVGRQMMDPATFASLYAEAERLLADNVVIIPIAARRDILAVRSDRIAGYHHNPTDAGFTWNIERWYVP